MEKKELLKQIALFEKISDKSLSALADICISKHISKRQTLFSEGNKGLCLYILVTGNIQLSKSTPDARDIVIRVVKPGEIFGEVILFEQDCYPVTAVALKTSMVYMVSKHQFSCLLKNEDFSMDFFGTLMKKLRYLTSQIQYLSSHDVEDRLFLFIKDQFGKEEHVIPGLSKKDMAAAIGTTPETFSRLLLRLKKEDKLFWEGKKITISKDVWDY